MVLLAQEEEDARVEPLLAHVSQSVHAHVERGVRALRVVVAVIPPASGLRPFPRPRWAGGWGTRRDRRGYGGHAGTGCAWRPTSDERNRSSTPSTTFCHPSTSCTATLGKVPKLAPRRPTQPFLALTLVPWMLVGRGRKRGRAGSGVDNPPGSTLTAEAERRGRKDCAGRTRAGRGPTRGTSRTPRGRVDARWLARRGP